MASGPAAAGIRPEPEAGDPAEPFDEAGAPAGPSDAEEADFLSSQQAGPGDPLSAGLGPVTEVESPATKLPALDELVRRIPDEARAVMDELFRAKFVRVQRVPKAALHS